MNASSQEAARALGPARRVLSCTCALVMLGLDFAQPLTAMAAIRMVARSGQSAPGTEVVFSGADLLFGPPTLNGSGQTAFYAHLAGSGVDFNNRAGYWSEGSGLLSLVARQGDPAPGTSDGVSFGGFRLPQQQEGLPPALNSNGQTAFYATLVGPQTGPSNNRGIWSSGSGDLALVVRAGHQIPGSEAGAQFQQFREPVLNDAGNTAFLASGGVWLAESGTLAAVARTGSPAPGSPLQDEFSGFQSLLSGYRPSLALNGEGQVAFWAMTELSGEGIWTGRPESLASVAVNGDSAPGAESGVTFSRFSLLLGKEAPALNAAGQTAFTGYLSGEELDLLSSRGIWSNGSGDLALVARGGTQAPGTENGINFDLFEAPVLNGTGRTAFTALLTGDGVNSSNNYGIWAEGVDGLELIARRGNSAPGLPSGVTFAGFGGQQQLVLNHAGQVAFMAALSGNGLNPSTQKGIWATDHNGELQLIVRTGSQIEVAAGEFRTVIDLQFVGGSGNQDGRPSGFNDRGQLAFSATFVGGVSGVFVSNAVAEPSAYGDFNGDGAVNGADLLAWQRGESPEALSDADLAAWRLNFGIGAAAANQAAVPEPAAAVLGMLGLAAVWRGRGGGACRGGRG